MDALLQSAWFGPFVKGILTVLLISGAVLLAFLIGYGLRKLMFPKLVKLHTINLTNSGNVSGCYNLKAVAQEEFLQFIFLLNRVPLPRVEISSGIADVGYHQPRENQAAELKPGSSNQQKQAVSQTNQGRPGGGAGKLLKGSEKAVAKTGAAAGLLGMLGSILPGDLGKSMKQQGSALRDVQTKSKMAMDKPKDMQRKVDSVQQQSGRLAGKAVPSQQPSSPVKYVAATSGSSFEQKQTLEFSTNHQADITPGEIYYHTMQINPGESVKLELKISAHKKRYPDGSYSYKVISQQVPEGSFERTPQAATKQGVVNFGQIKRWHYWLPNFLTVLLVSGLMFITSYAVFLVWR